MEEHGDKHTIGGVACIIGGAFGVLGLMVMILAIIFVRYMLGQFPINDITGLPLNIQSIIVIFYGVCGLFFLILGILGIAGGISALKRRNWGLALTGAIAGTFTFFPCGIVAVIFIAMARPEFSKPRLIDIPGI